MHIPVIGHVLLLKRVMTTIVVEKGHMLLFFFISIIIYLTLFKKYQLFLGRYIVSICFLNLNYKFFRFSNYIDLFFKLLPLVYKGFKKYKYQL